MIFPYHISDLKDYNEIGERAFKLLKSKKDDIIEGLWYNVFETALLNFQFDHPELFDEEAEAQDDIDNPVYYLGKRVKFKMKKKDEQKEE